MEGILTNHPREDSQITTLSKIGVMVRQAELWLRQGERTVSIEGLSARFKITTRTDVYRLNENFEGEYAREIITIFKELGKKGSVVNIGAAQGFYAIYSALAGNGVIAIEPDPVTFDALKENISLNGLEGKIECIKCAIGDKKEEKTLFTDETRSDAPSFIQTVSQKKQITVPVFWIDEVVRHNPDVLVVDVEGYEENVLGGMGELRPREIFIEIHPRLLARIGKGQISVQKLLSDMGYELKSQYMRGKELHCHYSLKIEDH